MLNKIKDWFTDILGATMMVGALVLTFTNKVDFIWVGLGILLAGFVLMSIPDKEIVAAIKKWADKKFNNSNNKEES